MRNKGVIVEPELRHESTCVRVNYRVETIEAYRSGGLAQASQSSAVISLTEGTASRVISDDAIDNQDRSRVTISHRTW